ncbi:MAG TPA: efflux RND transporter periplasmic adaptor subunit, partial [Candidatus Didemnitutus sp.]|nr:efflux RND transporter periplasmic adaptor subunit [Candidatus Didemnitutus sp.]
MKTNLSLITFIILCACHTEPTQKPASEGEYYTCSMDPQVIESKPGNCPICKMPLTIAKMNTSQAPDEIELSDQQVVLGNIATDRLQMTSIGDEVNLTGLLAWDERKVIDVSTRVAGRVEQLFVKSVGELVVRGQPLYVLYSEELNTATREYLLAIASAKELSPEYSRGETFVKTTRKKLSLLGLTDGQIAKLSADAPLNNSITILSPTSGTVKTIDAREGDYLMEGASILQVADPTALWAEAEIYPDDLSRIGEQSHVQLRFPAAPQLIMNTFIRFIPPEAETKTRITRARVDVANSRGILRPGMQVEFNVALNQKKAHTLPIDAVIRGSNGNSIWIEIADNRFKNIMVETGAESGGRIEIRSAL